MLDIERNLRNVRHRIRLAENKYQREAGSVQLVAVSKTKPDVSIQSALLAGQCVFGESYVQEAVDKIDRFNNAALEWHFIGPVQSNKTKLISNHFAWVHSVDRLKIAQRLNEQRSETLPRLNICLQVNLSEETTKSGLPVQALNALVESILILPMLNLRGLMVIPHQSSSFEDQRKPFRALKELKEGIEQRFGITLDTLSMGMSADLEAAIAEGASHVRIGTDIFGSRNKRV